MLGFKNDSNFEKEKWKCKWSDLEHFSTGNDVELAKLTEKV